MDKGSLKAGETVCQTVVVPEGVLFTLNTVFQRVCQTLFVSKRAPETLIAPPFMKRVTGLGYGTRHGAHGRRGHEDLADARDGAGMLREPRGAPGQQRQLQLAAKRQLRALRIHQVQGHLVG